MPKKIFSFLSVLFAAVFIINAYALNAEGGGFFAAAANAVPQSITGMSAAFEIWDGSVAKSFAGGGGTKENPYKIANAAQLAFLAQAVNGDVADALSGGKYRISKYYVLVNDIYLNDTAEWESWNEGKPDKTMLNKWTPIGAEYKDFSGDFDGCGFSVYGVYINADSDNQALFGSVNLGRISNLGVEQSYVKGKQYVGGVGGWLGGSDIINCYNAGAVSGAGSCTGGVAGYAGRSTVIINCFNSGTVGGHDNTGGIAGRLDRGGSVLNCYNTGDIFGEGYPVGGIAGYVDYGEADGTGSVVRNCYSTGRVSEQVKSGGVAGYADNGCTVSHCYYLKTAGINGGLEASASKSFGVSNVSSFNSAGALTAPVAVNGREYSVLTDALNAFIIADSGAAGYAAWYGGAFPGFAGHTPAQYPSALTAVYGGNLSVMDLSRFNDGYGCWAWAAPAADSGAAGVNYFAAVYTPDSSTGGNTLTVQLAVTVTPKPLADELKPVAGTFVYNGSPHTPAAEVTGLVLNTDYTVSYSDNTGPGTATLTITGIGNYSGELSVSFMITKAAVWEWYYSLLIVFAVIALCGAGFAVWYMLKCRRLASAGSAADIPVAPLPAPALVPVSARQEYTGAVPPLSPAFPKGLTKREREVAVEVLTGMSSKEIGKKLFISLPTVKGHIANILSKSGCANKVEFIVKYGNNGGGAKDK